jgi:hypothetical protein
VTGKALTPIAPARRSFPAPLFILIGIAGALLLVIGLWQFSRGESSAQPLLTATTKNVVTTTAPLVSATATRSAPTPTVESSATLAPAATATLVLASSPIALSATATPLVPWTACPNTLLSRLRVGYHAFVSLDPPDPNRIREQPGTQARVLGQIQPGEEIEILEGPACVNGWVWWKVRSQKTGLTGWTAEGKTNIYWLVPIATVTPAPRLFNFFACAQPCLADGSNAARTFLGGITSSMLVGTTKTFRSALITFGPGR